MGGRARGPGGTVGWVVWLILLSTVAGLATPAAADITYIYDELGRLRAVIDPSQTDGTALYSYDAVGNILSITRQASSLVSIIEFNPKRGPVGSTVTIQGTGFSATPSQNAVTFNGVAATVTSATATQLVTTVPSGATTGTIGLTVTGVGSTSSLEPFTVTSDTGAPTITSFTPGIGLAGSVVALSGTNFEPVAANNRVAVNVLRAHVASAAPTTLETTVPSKATSGRFSVRTPAGSATSPAYFFIPPAPYTPADVAVTDSMAIGGAKTLTIPTVNKVGLVVFDGTAGQRISLRMTAVTITFSAIKIYTPDGAQLGPEVFVNTSGAFYDVQTLPKSGTYQILVDPTSTYTGNMTLTLYDVPADPTGTLVAGGAPVSPALTVPGQNALYTFAGVAGQRVSVTFTNVTVTQSFAHITKPDGTVLAPTISVFAGSVGFIDTLALPVTGSYTLRIDPLGIATGTMTVTLYGVVDVTGTITPGGSAVTVTFTTPGQGALYTLTGAAGQQVSLTVSASTPSGAGLWVSIRKPDGTNQVNPVFTGSVGGFLGPTTLGAAGTYTVFADPTAAWTGSMTLTLYDVPADVTGPITPGGSPVSATLSTPGQNARLTFSGTANQRVSLQMTGVTITSSTVSILKPDSTTLATLAVGTSGGFIDAQTLLVTGTYTVLVDPQASATGSMTLTLYDAADATGSITPGGSPVTLDLTVPGQNARVTFAGTTGQRVSARVTTTIMSGSFALLKPDGTTLASSGLGGGVGWIDTQSLPSTGTYTLLVDHGGSGTSSITVTAWEVPADVTGSLTIGGAGVLVTLATPGQNGFLTFSGTQGQSATVRVTGNSIAGNGVNVTLKRPDGVVLTTSWSNGASFNLAAQTLPANGTYTIEVNPNLFMTGSATVSVTSP